MNIGNKGLIFPKLSYGITGVLFEIHDELGRYCREKQYADLFEKILKDKNKNYKREYIVGKTGNRLDFIIENRVVVEFKAKPNITKDDYYQLQRYLQITGYRLGLLVNFRSKYLKPIRVIRIETDARKKFLQENKDKN